MIVYIGNSTPKDIYYLNITKGDFLPKILLSYLTKYNVYTKVKQYPTAKSLKIAKIIVGAWG
jgi:hypothetical protein